MSTAPAMVGHMCTASHRLRLRARSITASPAALVALALLSVLALRPAAPRLSQRLPASGVPCKQENNSAQGCCSCQHRGSEGGRIPCGSAGACQPVICATEPTLAKLYFCHAYG